jgi:CRP/FNR family transcriptional regulator
MPLSIEKSAFGVAGPCDKPQGLRCSVCILDVSGYFRSLSIAAKRALQGAMQLVSYERHRWLYAEGDPSNCLYVLLSGEVKLYKSLSNGRQHIHKLVLIPGDLIACEDLFLDRHSSSAETLSDVVVCGIQKNRLQRIVTEHPEISDTLMRTMTRNLNAYIRHVANLGQKNALERLASYLLFLHETHEERHLRSELLMTSLTRGELADILGVTQRTLIRGLKKLQANKIISLARGGFVILDHPALVRLGEGSTL